MRREGLSLAAATVALAACTTPAPADAPGRLVTGAWGGTHVGLVLEPSGGRLEYDCASGSIDQPLRVDAAGLFTAHGTHVPGRGGPDVEGYIPPRHPALYSGDVRGDRMTLRVRIPATGIEIGPLTLRRNVQPTLFRCL